MTHTFVAFIDESGDEGFKIAQPPQRMSSEWFIMGAAVCRRSILRVIENRARHYPGLHFVKGRHHQCVEWAEMVAGAPVTAFCVIAHKPSMPNQAALRNERHYLFNYCTKLLIERISWYCNEMRGSLPGVCRIVFSDRGQLRLDRIKQYLRHLKTYAPSRTSIRWNVIDIEQIEVGTSATHPPLVFGDVIASGCAKALEYSTSRNTEHRFMKIMKHVFYRRNGRALSYGVKFVSDELPGGPPLPARFHWLHHFK